MMNDRNEIKISFKEPKFHIDKANKAVVCILEGTPRYPKAIDYTFTTITNLRYIDGDYIKVKAIAKLSPDDNFDENIGMKVALAKAENKAYEQVCTNLKEYMRSINTVIEQCKDFFYKSANVIEHNDRYLEQF
jgi:hypothetical protein